MEEPLVKTLSFSVHGNMPYENRLQLLDLLFWRLIQYGADREVELLERGILPRHADGIFSSVFEQAKNVLEEIRTPSEFDSDWHFRYFEEEFFDRRPRKEREQTVYLYPYVITVRHRKSILEDLLSHEKLALATAGLAIAAAGTKFYGIEEIQTLNPLNVKAILKNPVALIAVLAYIFNVGSTFPERYHMEEFCSNITYSYQEELASKHIDKEHALMLGEALQACYSSPIFTGSPITITTNEEGK